MSGAAHGRSKITEAQAVTILQDIKTGTPYMAIAIKNGIHYQHVYRIAKGKRWAHLPR